MKTNSDTWFWRRRWKPRIFITYRRSGEGQGYGGRLADKLIEYFGAWQCFRDVENIEMGVDFVESITRAVAICEVLVVVIGPDWTTQKDKDGRPRLQNKNDFVRLEVAAALERNIRVIPVLVGGAQVATEDELPDDLKALCRRQAHEVTDTRWDYDVEKLVHQIELAGIKGRSPSERAALMHRVKVGAAVLFTAVTAVSAMMLWSNFPQLNPKDSTPPTVLRPEAEAVKKTDTDLPAEGGKAMSPDNGAEQRAKDAEQRARDAEQRAKQARLDEQRAKDAASRAAQARETRERKLRGVSGSVLVGWWNSEILYASLLRMDGAFGTATVSYHHPQFGQLTIVHDLRFSAESGAGFDYVLEGSNARPPVYAPDSFGLVEDAGYVAVRNTCDIQGLCSELMSAQGRFAHVH